MRQDLLFLMMQLIGIFQYIFPGLYLVFQTS